MDEQPGPILVVEGLRVEMASGADIVDQVSFTVRSGRVLALVGESGCGKTSTALALLGHARAGTRLAAGAVTLGGRDILRLTPAQLRHERGARIAYVPQDPSASLNPRHRVGDQIAEVLRTHGGGKEEAARRVRALAEQVRLPSDDAFLRRYPFELSGGQQQRVAIAMAVACAPLAVVLDEPTTGLDVTTQARVLDLVRDLSKQTGAAFVYVTHDLAVVDTIADDVAVMYAGRMVEYGPRERVFRSPAHPYTALLLSAVPRLAIRRHLTGIAGTAPAPGTRPTGCFFAPRCPVAIDRCRDAFPPEVSLETGHLARCWQAATYTPPASTALALSGAPRAPDQTLLAVDRLVASYGRGAGRRAVLHGATFALAAGECLAVVGESGSGKTTLGRCVVGLHRPDAGAVTLHGAPLARVASERPRAQQQAIGIVFQNPDRSLNPRETVGDAIARPLRLYTTENGAARRGHAAELLSRVRLPTSALDRYPRELSGGEKQRVAIARALAASPSLVICDEITSALDVSIQAAIVELLGELRRDGLALLFITHNLALVNSIADRVLVLEAGEVRECGATAQVISRPEHRYTRALLAAAPELSRA